MVRLDRILPSLNARVAHPRDSSAGRRPCANGQSTRTSHKHHLLPDSVEGKLTIPIPGTDEYQIDLGRAARRMPFPLGSYVDPSVLFTEAAATAAGVGTPQLLGRGILRAPSLNAPQHALIWKIIRSTNTPKASAWRSVAWPSECWRPSSRPARLLHRRWRAPWSRSRAMTFEPASWWVSGPAWSLRPSP